MGRCQSILGAAGPIGRGGHVPDGGRSMGRVTDRGQWMKFAVYIHLYDDHLDRGRVRGARAKRAVEPPGVGVGVSQRYGGFGGVTVRVTVFRWSGGRRRAQRAADENRLGLGLGLI